MEAVADSAVVVCHAIADAMRCVSMLRFRRVRDICFPVSL
jgi:hypothetical protein